MPRGVLVVCFLNVVASRLPRCALWAASSSRLTFSFGPATPYGRGPHYGVHLALPAPRSGIPLCPYDLFILLYISPIYPSPLVYWLCHTFVVYQQDSSLIRAKASPLPLSLVLSFWALSPPLGI